MRLNEELREDTRGSDPIYKDIHRQLTEAGIEFVTPFDLDSLTLEPGKGLSPRMMHKIEESIAIVLPATQQALARGDISIIRYELDELLKVFQINLDPTSASYRKLARAVMEAFVKAMKAKQARNKGEPVPTPPLVLLSAEGAVPGGTLHEALEGWKKERNPSRGVLVEHERAIRLFGELHGALPVARRLSGHMRVHFVKRFKTCRDTGRQNFSMRHCQS